MLRLQSRFVWAAVLRVISERGGKDPSQAFDPFVNILQRGVGEVEPQGVDPVALGIERLAGNVGDLLFDGRLEERRGIDTFGQPHPQKQATLRLGPVESVKIGHEIFESF